MKYPLRQTSTFKKDFKRIKGRGYNLNLPAEVIRILQSGDDLPAK